MNNGMSSDVANLLMLEGQEEEAEFKKRAQAHLDLMKNKCSQFDYSVTSDDLSQLNYLTNYVKKPNLPVRDLNNFDSYTIQASRVDEDGLTRYLVVWNDGENTDDENQGRSIKVGETMKLDQEPPELRVETTPAEKTDKIKPVSHHKKKKKNPSNITKKI